MRIKHWIVLLILLTIVFFAIQNSDLTEVKFLFWKLQASRVIIIVGSFVCGLFAGLLLAKRTTITNHSQLKK